MHVFFIHVSQGGSFEPGLLGGQERPSGRAKADESYETQRGTDFKVFAQLASQVQNAFGISTEGNLV